MPKENSGELKLINFTLVVMAIVFPLVFLCVHIQHKEKYNRAVLEVMTHHFPHGLKEISSHGDHEAKLKPEDIVLVSALCIDTIRMVDKSDSQTIADSPFRNSPDVIRKTCQKFGSGFHDGIVSYGSIRLTADIIQKNVDAINSKNLQIQAKSAIKTLVEIKQN